MARTPRASDACNCTDAVPWGHTRTSPTGTTCCPCHQTRCRHWAQREQHRSPTQSGQTWAEQGMGHSGQQRGVPQKVIPQKAPTQTPLPTHTPLTDLAVCSIRVRRPVWASTVNTLWSDPPMAASPVVGFTLMQSRGRSERSTTTPVSTSTHTQNRMTGEAVQTHAHLHQAPHVNDLALPTKQASLLASGSFPQKRTATNQSVSTSHQHFHTPHSRAAEPAHYGANPPPPPTHTCTCTHLPTRTRARIKELPSEAGRGRGERGEEWSPINPTPSHTHLRDPPDPGSTESPGGPHAWWLQQGPRRPAAHHPLTHDHGHWQSERSVQSPPANTWPGGNRSRRGGH